MKKKIISLTLVLITAVLLICTLSSCGDPEKVTHHATIVIKDYGTIELELYGNAAPKTVANFEKLANSGFYDGLTFHRIISGFMIQGGGFLENGYYKEADTIKGEFEANGVNNPILHERGVISMARSDPFDSASSQFFIIHQTSPHLDGLYAAFGRVTSGIEIVDEICFDVEQGYNGAVALGDRPVITSVRVTKA